MPSSPAPQPSSHTVDSPAPQHGGAWSWPALGVALLVTYLSARVLVGADALWMVALGDHVVDTGKVPAGLPFAAADTAHWPNVPVFGELVLHLAHATGALGLPLLLLAADAGCLVVLARSAVRHGAAPMAAAGSLVVVAAGMLPVLGVVRGQLLSLVPWAVLVAILRNEHQAPSRWVWLVVPVVAVWGNLHGGVLVGVALVGCHLLVSRLRRRPVESVLVGLATLAAVWVNPAHVRTGEYYVGVLGNEAAARGTELWSRPDLSSGFDLLLVVCAAVLFVVAAGWGRLTGWEWLAAAGMALATMSAARHGMWLLLFLLGPAARGLTRLGSSRTSTGAAQASRSALRVPTAALLAGTLGLLAVSGVTLVRREAVLRGPVDVVAAVSAAAGSGTVLAPEPLAEDLAAAGVTVWASNPIDAFDRADQAAYLDVWLGRPAPRVLAAVDLAVTPAGSLVARRLEAAGFTASGSVGGYGLWRAPSAQVKS